jgi:hypothetical protein
MRPLTRGIRNIFAKTSSPGVLIVSASCLYSFRYINIARILGHRPLFFLPLYLIPDQRVMVDPDNLSGKKDSERKPPPSPSQQSEISLIPQIILTEPSASQEPTIHSIGIDSSPPHGLSPKAADPIPASTPLPLTKDLLQRKNKLDRLLSQKEKHRQRSSEVFSANAAVDERVTAGLGISTPKDNGGLRSRRMSSSRLSNRSEPEKAMTTALPNQQSHSEWSYDLDMFKSTTSGSSKGHKPKQTTGTSVSGSSNRNSVSMRAYSANHRYMDSKYHDRSNYDFERPNQPLRRADHQSKYYLIDLLYCAVIRVVNSRAPESKEVSNKEIFDLGHHPVIKAQDQDALVTNPSEKADFEATSPHISKNIRFSFLSANTASIDEKSFDFDNESLAYHTIEKKSSVKNDTGIPPPLPVAPIPAEKPISLSEEAQPLPLQGHSLFVFGPHNPFRIWAWKFIRSRYVYIQLLKTKCSMFRLKTHRNVYLVVNDTSLVSTGLCTYHSQRSKVNVWWPVDTLPHLMYSVPLQVILTIYSDIFLS